MQIIKTTADLAELPHVQKGCVLTIGNFDGVHLGHQEILTAAKQTAAKRSTELIVMTFEPHPLVVARPQQKPGILTPLSLKKHLLAEAGADCLLVVGTTQQLLDLSPDDFVQRFIVENIQPCVVVEGESFNFGAGRAGSIHTFRELGRKKGFEVCVIEAREAELTSGQKVKVSSTLIRDMLKTGGVADAAVALSRPYRLIGQIIPGQGKGKQLGFPTANLGPTEQIVCADGVYAGFVEIADSEEKVCAARDKIPAALSLGRAQTLGTDIPQLIEAHLLTDKVGDLYGRWLAMDFMDRIRSQKKFDTEKDLTAQIAKDCEKAKQILTGQR
jgi:riboflavin kinase/FMN adenylyltransferase